MFEFQINTRINKLNASDASTYRYFLNRLVTLVSASTPRLLLIMPAACSRCTLVVCKTKSTRFSKLIGVASHIIINLRV